MSATCRHKVALELGLREKAPRATEALFKRGSPCWAAFSEWVDASCATPTGVRTAD